MIKQAKIKEENGKFVLYTSDESRILGTHDTYEDALRQERAIQISKRMRAKYASDKSTGSGGLVKSFIENRKGDARQLRYLIRHKADVYKSGRELGAPRIQLLLHDWSKLKPSN